MVGDPEGAPPHGTLDSWMRDGFLTCLSTPAALVLAGSATATALGAGPGSENVLALAGLAVVLGGGLGITLGLLAGMLAHEACARSPAVAALGGPLAGAAGALGMVALVAGTAPDPTALRHVATAGAILLGPPWVGYVAVRSRGRSGLVVLPVTWLWVGTLGAAAMAWQVLG